MTLRSIAVLLVACSPDADPPCTAPAPAPAPIVVAVADPDWASRFDFDGDHIPDPISVAYSGGGHCCYTVSVALSRTHRDLDIPFQLDGGYVGGFDLSQPWNFDVKVGADGVAKLWMRIASYAGRPDPIPLEWVSRYGIHSHAIWVTLRDGTVHADNVMGECAGALDVIARLELAGWDGLPPCTRGELAEHFDVSMHPGLERELGTAKRGVETKRVIVDLDRSEELTLSIDDALVRVDVDDERPAAHVVDAFGQPEARLPYTLWGTKHPTGQWVWPARGLVVYVTGATVQHIGVFAPTDLATYRRTLAWL